MHHELEQIRQMLERLSKPIKRSALEQDIDTIMHRAPSYTAEESKTISAAMEILGRYAKKPDPITSPQAARDYIRLKLAGQEQEIFAAAWLDSQHGVIAFETLGIGTLSSTQVPTREVIKSALAHNAGAVIFAHNHPSGDPTPSDADIRLTKLFEKALAPIGVRVLDHVIVGGPEYTSLREKGFIERD